MAKKKRTGPGKNETSFKPGDERIPAVRDRSRPFVEVEGTGLLRDYRHVMSNPRRFDSNDRHRLLRRLMEKDEKAFLDRLEVLEIAELKSIGKDKSEEDLGTEKALKLLDQLLEECDARLRGVEQKNPKRTGRKPQVSTGTAEVVQGEPGIPESSDRSLPAGHPVLHQLPSEGDARPDESWASADSGSHI